MSAARTGSLDLEGFSAPAGKGRRAKVMSSPSRPSPPTWKGWIDRSRRDNHFEVDSRMIRSGLGMSDFLRVMCATPPPPPGSWPMRHAPCARAVRSVPSMLDAWDRSISVFNATLPPPITFIVPKERRSGANSARAEATEDERPWTFCRRQGRGT